MKESDFQHRIIKDIEGRLPGCIIMKNDATYIQGIPDLLVLWKDRWAALEVKRSKEECEKCIRTNKPANQKYYVDLMNAMSFASYIYPEISEEVLNELERSFKARRNSRVSRS